MAWHWIGNKSLSEPMLTDSLMHRCGTRGKWVKVPQITSDLLVCSTFHSYQQKSSILLALCDGNPLVTSEFPSNAERQCRKCIHDMMFPCHIFCQLSACSRKQDGFKWKTNSWCLACLQKCLIIIHWAIHINHQHIAVSPSWWRHEMETLSALLALCEENSPATGGFPSQRASHAQLWCFL